MGYDLLGKDSSFHLSASLWGEALGLATRCGWVPKGTTLPWDSKEAGEDAGYESNDEQLVDDEDARNLGLALERALADVPNGVPYGVMAEWKAPMHALVQFCRTGAFAIT